MSSNNNNIVYVSDEEFARQLREELGEDEVHDSKGSISLSGTYAAPPPGGYANSHVEPAIALQPFDGVADEPITTLDYASLVSLNRKSLTVKWMALIDFVRIWSFFSLPNVHACLGIWSVRFACAKPLLVELWCAVWSLWCMGNAQVQQTPRSCGQ